MISFFNPLLLYGLSLVSIPIIIHFFNFQRSKKVYFTNVAFLASVKQITNSQSKLRNILVLIARILFIVFLVLAFARPYLPQKNAQAVAASPYVSIYLDNSYSLQNEKDNQPLFNKSILYVDQLTKIFSSSTLFQLLDNSFEGNLNYFMDKGKLQDELSQQRFSNTGRNLAEVYRRQLIALENVGSERGNQILWISDFQRSTVGDLTELALDSVNQFYLILLQPDNDANLFVDSVWLDNPFIQERENNILNIQVQNVGLEEAAEKTVSLYIDDKQVSSATVSVAGQSSTKLALNFAVTDPGDKKCRVVIEDNPITFDNEYFFTIKVAPTIRIVGISNGSGDYIRNVFADESFFQTQLFNYTSIDYSSLEKADLIILEGLPRIENSLLLSVQRAISQGASLAVFPSYPLDEAAYTSLLQIPVREVPPATEGTPRPQVAIAPPDAQNPFFENVFEKVNANMSMPNVAPVMSWEMTGSLLLRLRNDQPFLSVFNRDLGKIYAFSAPLDPRFTDFPKHALFVPTMYKIALSSKVKSERLAFSFNEPVALVQLDSIGKNDIFKLSNQQTKVEIIPAQRISGAKLYIDVPNNDLEAGNYDIARSSTGEVATTVAFNYDHTESDIATYSEEEIRQIFGKYSNVNILKISDEDNFMAEFSAQTMSTPLWRYMLILALLCLLAETLLIRFWKTA